MISRVLCLLLVTVPLYADDLRDKATLFDPGVDQPFGRLNVDAPPETRQFAFMIGRNDCIEEKRNNQTNEWGPKQSRIWDAAWYMNGLAVRDWGTTAGGHTGNIRMFDEKSGLWHVTYFSMPGYGSGVWKGGMQGDEMVLGLPQKAPNGMDGESRLTFHDITYTSFKWKGEWVSADGTVVYPFWRIECRKNS